MVVGWLWLLLLAAASQDVAPLMNAVGFLGSAINIDVSKALSISNPGAVTWKLNGLPQGTGLSISSAGVVQGSPTNSDVSAKQPLQLVAVATDSNNVKSAVVLILGLLSSNTANTAITNIAGVGNFVQVDLSTVFKGSSTLVFSVDGLPSGTGLSMDSAKGMFSGIPTAADASAQQPLTLTVTARDSTTGGQGKLTLYLTVLDKLPEVSAAGVRSGATTAKPATATVKPATVKPGIVTATAKPGATTKPGAAVKATVKATVKTTAKPAVTTAKPAATPAAMLPLPTYAGVITKPLVFLGYAMATISTSMNATETENALDKACRTQYNPSATAMSEDQLFARSAVGLPARFTQSTPVFPKCSYAGCGIQSPYRLCVQADTAATSMRRQFGYFPTNAYTSAFGPISPQQAAQAQLSQQQLQAQLSQQQLQAQLNTQQLQAQAQLSQQQLQAQLNQQQLQAQLNQQQLQAQLNTQQLQAQAQLNSQQLQAQAQQNQAQLQLQLQLQQQQAQAQVQQVTPIQVTGTDPAFQQQLQQQQLQQQLQQQQLQQSQLLQQTPSPTAQPVLEAGLTAEEYQQLASGLQDSAYTELYNLAQRAQAQGLASVGLSSTDYQQILVLLQLNQISRLTGLTFPQIFQAGLLHSANPLQPNSGINFTSAPTPAPFAMLTTPPPQPATTVAPKTATVPPKTATVPPKTTTVPPVIPTTPPVTQSSPTRPPQPARYTAWPNSIAELGICVVQPSIQTLCVAEGDESVAIASLPRVYSQSPQPSIPQKSCAGNCGGKSDGCYCDTLCSITGDCCPDNHAVCTPPKGSCSAGCGQKSSQDCWCDGQCFMRGDCCGDFASICMP